MQCCTVAAATEAGIVTGGPSLCGTSGQYCQEPGINQLGMGLQATIVVSTELQHLDDLKETWAHVLLSHPHKP